MWFARCRLRIAHESTFVQFRRAGKAKRPRVRGEDRNPRAEGRKKSEVRSPNRPLATAGLGLNAFTRDEDHVREFIQRHQDKLLYGSDCNDHDGQGSKCSGAGMIAAIRRLSPTKDIQRKLLYKNARTVFRI